MRKVLTAVMAGAATLLIGVGPGLASDPPNYGSTVTCRYKTYEGTAFAGQAKVRKIVVSPPRMFAKSGQQTVGWRFIVSRTYGTEAAKTTYVSPIETAVASTTVAAAFATMSVAVSLPRVENLSWLEYRVTLRLIWYRGNGTVQSKITYPMPTYTMFYNGDPDRGYASCWGIVLWGP
jgi:hypothetical protein